MNKKSAYTVAIVGATGAVGTEILSVLAERKLPIDKVLPLASSKSAGGDVSFEGIELLVILLSQVSFL